MTDHTASTRLCSLACISCRPSLLFSAYVHTPASSPVMWHNSISPAIPRVALAPNLCGSRIESPHSLYPLRSVTYICRCCSLLATYMHTPAIISPVIWHHSDGPSLSWLARSPSRCCSCIESPHSLRSVCFARLHVSISLLWTYMHTPTTSPVTCHHPVSTSLPQLALPDCAVFPLRACTVSSLLRSLTCIC